MEWEIKPFGKESTYSGNPFQDGEEVHCFLIRNSEGALVRADLHGEDIENLDAGSVILGRWTRVFEASPDKREESLSRQRTLEALFFSLFDVGEAMEGEESHTIQLIVALMLERKRILRRVPARSSPAKTSYVHVKSKREFEVPIIDITPGIVMKVQKELAVLIR